MEKKQQTSANMRNVRQGEVHPAQLCNKLNEKP